MDEHLTTQCCWKCGVLCQPVAYPVTAWRSRCVVRGLVFCDSRTCGYFSNRDFQGALNIMVCGVGPRPEHMARTAVGVKRTDCRLLRPAENAGFG